MISQSTTAVCRAAVKAEGRGHREGKTRVVAHVTLLCDTYPDLDELLLLLLDEEDEEEEEEEELDDEEEEVPSRLSALCSNASAKLARSGLCSRSCTATDKPP